VGLKPSSSDLRALGSPWRLPRRTDDQQQL
jgi:hypothetical protein